MSVDSLTIECELDTDDLWSWRLVAYASEEYAETVESGTGYATEDEAWDAAIDRREAMEGAADLEDTERHLRRWVLRGYP